MARNEANLISANGQTLLSDTQDSTGRTSNEKYRVVALKYRPDNFDDLIGQSQVATAISNAIEKNRVGHAYLFTGARGVGKTSSARIFAKCLNCAKGPAIKPCGECDICLGVASGEDVDVLEIDGASNRGIDEIRQLRANANVRPSRARYKIYIIDEVHMLTVAAFNALLKTLEEPPAHVKFIFCTTDPEKIPITVLSRCQRFDFPPIKTQSIVGRLRHIVDQEGVEADDSALELLARRAGGSMRDSQSLLEQLLSYTSEKISVAEVHTLLGTADNEIVFHIADAIVANEAADALGKVNEAVDGGVDSGQLAEQLLGLFRDAMAANVGCGEELLLHGGQDDLPRLKKLSEALGVEKVLAILQILDSTLVKVRHSTHVRTLLETAIVRCCHLQNLDQIPQLIQQLQGGPASVGSGLAAKKKREPVKVAVAEASPQPVQPQTVETKATEPKAQPSPSAKVEEDSTAAPVETLVKADKQADKPTISPNSGEAKVEERQPLASEDFSNTGDSSDPDNSAAPVATLKAPKLQLNQSNLEKTWRNAMAGFKDMTGEAACNFESIQLKEGGVQVTLKSSMDQDLCSRPEPKQRIERAMELATGQKLRIDFEVSSKSSGSSSARPVRISRRQLIQQAENHPFVKAATELFEAEITDVIPPRGGK